MEWYLYAIAIIGGFFSGVINTLAGNGSAITLTILMEVLGLPSDLANGTNRVGVLTQTSASSLAFYRNGKLNLNRSSTYIVITVLGAILGVFAALNVSNEDFRSIFRFLMLFMLVVILVRPKRWLRATDLDYKLSKRWSFPLFLAIGFYGGFIQMGMGVFFLAIMVLIARYSIMEANAVKLAVIAIYTLIVVAIFEYQGLIDWKIGLIIASGQTLGGYLTAHYASKYEGANVWAHRLLVVVVIAAIIKLFDLHELIL